MAKNRNDYFKLIEEQLGFCVSASALLSEILGCCTKDNIIEYKQKMHDIEHAADDIRHDILTRLSIEFITPIDQEDILQLVQIIDDITDLLDDVVIKLYMFDIGEIPASATLMASNVDKCVKALLNAGAELRNFKKPEKLRQHLIEVNTAEGEADELYMSAIRNLFVSETDPKILIGHKGVYDNLEECCDMCEHAADVIEQIIIKNT